MGLLLAVVASRWFDQGFDQEENTSQAASKAAAQQSRKTLPSDAALFFAGQALGEL